MPRNRSKSDTPSMAELFLARLEHIITRAERMGLTLTDICRDTKISRQTPDRWRAKIPETIAKIDEMERYVAEKEDKLKRELHAN